MSHNTHRDNRDYRPTDEYFPGKPEDHENLFFYEGTVVKVNKELGNDKYEIHNPWVSPHAWKADCTELHYPTRADWIDYLVNDIKTAIEISDTTMPGSLAIELLQQALKIIMDKQLDKKFDKQSTQ